MSGRSDFNTTFLATFIGAGLTGIHSAATASTEPDRFVGWKGKHFKATEFFRVEKDERWWLFTPEGKAFLSFDMNPFAPSEMMPMCRMAKAWSISRPRAHSKVRRKV